jgi:predicted dehydrogenase
MPAPAQFLPRIAVTGLGGYSRHHHLTLQRLEREGCCRVVATCDPASEAVLPAFADLRLAERGVRVYADFATMLEALPGAADAVTLPTPIHLHAPMHRACVERGLPVYLEKPPTLWWEELEDMIAIDARATRPTEVGFNFTSEPARQALKARLVAGEFGRLIEASFWGSWPRPEGYFTRNNWAGRLFPPGGTVPLLDSCIGNAMGHFVQNLLFWAAPQPAGFATVMEVRASLYRAHAITGTDTVFAEARTAEGVVLRVAATHASAPPREEHAEWVRCERAQWRYVTGQECEILWDDGRREQLDLRADADWQERNFRQYFKYLAGEQAGPVNSLAACRPFVAFNDLLYAATPGIIEVGGTLVDSLSHGSQGGYRAIRGVVPALQRWAEAGEWPGGPNSPWAREPGRAHLADLPMVAVKLRALAGRGGPAFAKES